MSLLEEVCESGSNGASTVYLDRQLQDARLQLLSSLWVDIILVRVDDVPHHLVLNRANLHHVIDFGDRGQVHVFVQDYFVVACINDLLCSMVLLKYRELRTFVDVFRSKIVFRHVNVDLEADVRGLDYERNRVATVLNSVLAQHALAAGAAEMVHCVVENEVSNSFSIQHTDTIHVSVQEWVNVFEDSLRHLVRHPILEDATLVVVNDLKPDANILLQ